MPERIFLSPSNQPANKYICSTMTEKRYCEKVCDNIASILNSQYYNELMLAPYDVAYNLRPSYAVTFDAKYYFCIHTNASGLKIGTARGAVVFYNNDEGKVIAENIVNKLNEISPHEENRDNQLVFRTSGLAEISSPHKFGMTCVFLEIDFHDNPSVCAWLLASQDQISDVIANSYAEGIGLKKKVIEVPPATVMYRVKIDGEQKMALSYYEKAVETMKNLIDAGAGKVGTVERDTDSKTLFTYLPPVTSLGILRGVVTAFRLNVRDQDSIVGKVLTQFDRDHEVALLKKSGNWYLVELPRAYPQRYGWISATYVKLVTVKTEIRYNTANLNLRSKPNATSTIIITIPKGKKLTAYGYVDGWFEIRYETFTGFVHGDYLSLEKVFPKPQEVQIVNCSRLNMRKSPKGAIIMSLPVGAKLELLDSSETDWYKVRFNGIEGFCSAKYLNRI